MSKDVNQTTPSVDKSEANVNSVQAQGGGELRQIINGAAQRFSTDPITKGSIWEGYIVPEGFMNRLVPTLESLIAARLTALLEGLRSEAIPISHTEDAIPFAVIDAEIERLRQKGGAGKPMFNGLPLDTPEGRKAEKEYWEKHDQM